MNAHISDIFFNSDNIGAFDIESGEWDRTILFEFAEETLDHLEALGVDSLPTTSELVQDFLDRI